MSEPFRARQSLDESAPHGFSPQGSVTWRERREQLRAWLSQNPALCPIDEVEAHFALMPSHYWESASGPDLVWGLQNAHAFFQKLAHPDAVATAPHLDWQISGDGRTARVMLCTWNRQGLLAKTAGTLSALNLNIVHAEACTREDQLVFDVFSLSRPQGRKLLDDQTCRDVEFLLAGALSEPPRFASVWAYSRHKYLTRKAAARPIVSLDNEAERASTLLRLEAKDRLGLLYDVLQSLSELGLDIQRARIDTQDGVARDQFTFTDREGLKVTDQNRLLEIRQRLELELA